MNLTLHCFRNIFMGVTFSLFFVAPAYSQSIPCTSHFGEPVQYIQDYNLNNVGIATRYQGRPIIVINPAILNQFSPLVQQWWLAHECGHHALSPHQNNEVNADCFASRALRDLGFIRSPADLQQVMRELSRLPGNIFTGHLPGPGRARVVMDCVFS